METLSEVGLDKVGMVNSDIELFKVMVASVL
jgi:hypothetical protein